MTEIQGTGSCLAQKSVRQFVPPICWDFFTDMGVVVVYGTTYVQLVHMCWPLLWGLHQIGRSFGGSV